jgi:REP element-mobilizing transposase RayT
MPMDRPHGCNLRLGRRSTAGFAFHVTFSTHHRELLLLDLRHGRLVVDGLRWQDTVGHTTTLAYVVMPDHVHWLFVLGESAELSRVVAGLKGYTARRLNAAIGRHGSPVWQAGYFDHAVRRDEDLLALGRYIVHNPLRAGLVREIGDYPLWDAWWA